MKEVDALRKDVVPKSEVDRQIHDGRERMENQLLAECLKLNFYNLKEFIPYGYARSSYSIRGWLKAVESIFKEASEDLYDTRGRKLHVYWKDIVEKKRAGKRPYAVDEDD
jgi:hypothetical protein